MLSYFYRFQKSFYSLGAIALGINPQQVRAEKRIKATCRPLKYI